MFRGALENSTANFSTAGEGRRSDKPLLKAAIGAFNDDGKIAGESHGFQTEHRCSLQRLFGAQVDVCHGGFARCRRWLGPRRGRPDCPRRGFIERGIDPQLHLYAKSADREGRHVCDLDKSRRHSTRYRLVGQRLQEIGGARHRRQLLLHLHCAGNLPILLLHTLLHGGHDRRRSGDGQQRNAVMLQSATAKWRSVYLSRARKRRTGLSQQKTERKSSIPSAALWLVLLRPISAVVLLPWVGTVTNSASMGLTTRPSVWCSIRHR